MTECQPDTPYKHGPEFYEYLRICGRCGKYRYRVWHYWEERGEICHGTPEGDGTMMLSHERGEELV